MADKVCSTCYRTVKKIGCLIKDDGEFVEANCPLWLSAEKWAEINSEKEKP